MTNVNHANNPSYVTFSTPLPNIYIKPRPLCPIAFPCSHKQNKNQTFASLMWITLWITEHQQHKLTASAAFLNQLNAVLLSCFTAVLPSEYIYQTSNSDLSVLNSSTLIPVNLLLSLVNHIPNHTPVFVWWGNKECYHSPRWDAGFQFSFIGKLSTRNSKSNFHCSHQ